MKEKKIILFAFILALLSSCGNDNKTTNPPQSENSADEASVSSDYDPKRGLGKYEKVELNTPLNPELIKKGQDIYELKCFACHKLTDEKLVGPGWKGVTDRQTPQWIMNFITNPDPMIDKDPELKKQLEICLTRMSNQNLTDDEARDVLEFMLKNDGK